MSRRQIQMLSVAVLGGVLLVPLRSAAQTDEQPAAASVTAEAVARLSLLDGEVHVSAAGYLADAADAALNMPVGAGEVLQTGAGAHAEVEFPDGSVLRSTANSAATLIRLRPQTEIGLDDGLYYLELRASTDSQFVVYAGDLSIQPRANTSFRVRVENGRPEVAVLLGAVSVTRASSYTVDLHQGESLRTDSNDSRRYLLADEIGPEPGDSWNERRSQQAEDAAASATIARNNFAGGQGYGWSDLDSSGSWYQLPSEGLVWQPYGIDASFDPYGYGSWVYGGFAGGGGYVWASSYPWGWLPYHCGSWGFYSGFGWGWQPAMGCGSYGGGWPGGGYPVRHAPHGWRGPRPPSFGGIVTRHPTVPVLPASGTVHLYAGGPHPPLPIQFKGEMYHPLSPVAAPPITHGTSAVGSALRRDYPIQSGTNVPLLGLASAGVAERPGRAPEWHAPPAVLNGAAERGDVRVAGTGVNEVQSRGQASPAGASGAAVISSGLAGANQTGTASWHSRVYSAGPSGLAGAAGSVSAPRSGVRVGPGPNGPTSTGSRGQVIAPGRPVQVAPAAPRSAAPAPASAPHYSSPSPSAPAHMSTPSSPSAPSSSHH